MLPPLVSHALESLEHGIEHYQEGKDRDRKFAFIHIDNAIELLLKEKVRLLKESIYRKNGKTISIWEAYKILEEKGVEIPQKPDLEIIHHERNAVQHQGVTPDVSKTEVYLGEVFPFFEEFSKRELGIEIGDYLSPDIVTILRKQPDAMLKGVPRSAPDLLNDAEVHMTTNPSYAVVTASTAIELVSRELASSAGSIQKPPHVIVTSFLQELHEKGLLDLRDVDSVRELRDVRKKVIHMGYEPTSDEARSAVESARRIVDGWFLLSGRKKEPTDK